MASQRVLIVTLGGRLASEAWRDICIWSDARTSQATDEWGPDDWPEATCLLVDAFVDKIASHALTPPVLYRSEHIDLWSMGDIFQRASFRSDRQVSRMLCTRENEVIATWAPLNGPKTPPSDKFSETGQLYRRVSEAFDAWEGRCDQRLVVMIRHLLGGLWTDDEVVESLDKVPEWWSATS